MLRAAVVTNPDMAMIHPDPSAVWLVAAALELRRTPDG